MEGRQNLYYALGEIAYAIAKSDGSVQYQEREKLHDIVKEQTRNHGLDFDITEIIFHIIHKENLDFEQAYEMGITTFQKNSHLLTDDLKIDFVAAIEKIAYAFDKVTIKEQSIIDRFRNDMVAI